MIQKRVQNISITYVCYIYLSTEGLRASDSSAKYQSVDIIRS